MFSCPSCNQKSISFWQKAWADRFLPGKCKECGVSFYKPLAKQMKYFYLVLIPMILVALIAFKYNLIPLLVLNILLLIWAFVKGIKKTPLYINNEQRENH